MTDEARNEELISELQSMDLSREDLILLVERLVGRKMTKEEWQSVLTLPRREAQEFLLEMYDGGRLQ